MSTHSQPLKFHSIFVTFFFFQFPLRHGSFLFGTSKVLQAYQCAKSQVVHELRLEDADLESRWDDRLGGEGEGDLMYWS